MLYFFVFLYIYTSWYRSLAEKGVRMIESVEKKAVEAHELEQTIANAVHDYVDDDETRAGFGINAAFRACIGLIKTSSMSPQTRMSFAQRIFLDMTDDLTPRTWHRK